jgi:hypothetical protein
MEEAALAPKKTQTEGRTIVFVDESGLSQRPDRVMQHQFNHRLAVLLPA